MANRVRDRSGVGLPPKAERRALGKIAARKRAQQRRRRELMRKAARIASPIVVIGIIVGAVWLFRGGDDAGTTPPDNAAQPTNTATTPAWTLPEGLDPQLGTKPVVTAGTEGPLKELKVTTLVKGTGAEVKAGDTITVNYLGVDYDTGVPFAGGSSWDPTPQPATGSLSGFIQGWQQGLVGVTVGSRVVLDIPEALAYPNPQGGQPEGDLRFVVDVLAVTSSTQ